jgi:hypothetical protein
MPAGISTGQILRGTSSSSPTRSAQPGQRGQTIWGRTTSEPASRALMKEMKNVRHTNTVVCSGEPRFAVLDNLLWLIESMRTNVGKEGCQQLPAASSEIPSLLELLLLASVGACVLWQRVGFMCLQLWVAASTLATYCSSFHKGPSCHAKCGTLYAAGKRNLAIKCSSTTCE